MISNIRHAVGYGDGGQTATAIERPIADARHAVGLPSRGNRLGYSDITSIFIAILAGGCSFVGNGHSIRC